MNKKKILQIISIVFFSFVVIILFATLSVDIVSKLFLCGSYDCGIESATLVKVLFFIAITVFYTVPIGVMLLGLFLIDKITK